MKNTRTIALLPILAAAIGITGAACTDCGASPGQVVSDIGKTVMTIEDVTCVLRVFSTEVQDGTDEVQAGLDAAGTCHVAQDVVSVFLASHRAAAIRERAKPADAGVDAQVEAGPVRFFVPAYRDAAYSTAL